jgi:SAM-dependent methyltransferase
MSKVDQFGQLIIDSLKSFAYDVANDEYRYPVDAEDFEQTYTRSVDYLLSTVNYHHDTTMKAYTDKLFSTVSGKIIDVGCCTGFMGLLFALRGERVTFADFEGAGLEFVRFFAKKNGLSVQVIPYSELDLSRHGVYDWALAFDVLEHAGNQLSFVRMMSILGQNVVISYPCLGYSPPFKRVIDDWVDDEAIRWIVNERYKVVEDLNGGGRRFLRWEISK